MNHPKRQVFYSFHYERDVARVQQIRNIGAIEDNKPVSANEWEEVKRKGTDAIRKWIDDNMQYRSCVVVLVGTETASRPWVQYEIKHAWENGKGVVGICIHNLKDFSGKTEPKGKNPFEYIPFENGNLSDVVKCYDPGLDPYRTIRMNLEDWIEEAIEIRKRY